MAEASWREAGPVAEALANLVVVLADNKYFLGRRISEWSTGAPELESAVACAAMAQEELGHSRALYSLLGELPVEDRPVPLEHEQDRQRRYCVAFLDEPFETWSHVVAALALIDTALVTLLEAARESRHEELARRAARILDEERFHAIFTHGRVRALAQEGAARLLQQRVDELLPEMLCWFGPAGEAGVEALKAAGVLKAGNEEMRQAYLNRVVLMLTEVGIQLPARWDEARRRWEYGELPWQGWNSLQRRLNRGVAVSQQR